MIIQKKGTWIDAINLLCTPCELSLDYCKKCNSKTNCIECEINYKFFGNTGSISCVITCPIGFYLNLKESKKRNMDWYGKWIMYLLWFNIK